MSSFPLVPEKDQLSQILSVVTRIVEEITKKYIYFKCTSIKIYAL